MCCTATCTSTTCTINLPSGGTAPGTAVTRISPGTTLAGVGHLLGLDIATQPANLAAAQYSRDADQPVMSAAGD